MVYVVTPRFPILKGMVRVNMMLNNILILSSSLEKMKFSFLTKVSNTVSLVGKAFSLLQVLPHVFD